jgi:hypothetical protein
MTTAMLAMEEEEEEEFDFGADDDDDTFGLVRQTNVDADIQAACRVVKS